LAVVERRTGVIEIPALQLSATGMSPDELFTEWMAYQNLCGEVGEIIESMWAGWQKETNPALRDRLNAELDDVRPHYEVLRAWTELFHSAWVFSTYGCESRFVLGKTRVAEC
jgi:hypothetical protein